MSRSSTPSKILYPAGAAPFTQAAFDKYLSDNDGCLPPGALYQILDGPNAGIWVAPTIEGADPVCLASKDQVAALSDALDGLVIPTADGETIEAAADGTWSVPALTGGGEGQYLTVDANGDLVWSDLPASGGGAVETDATLTGDGSVADPLGLPLLSDLGAAPTVLGPPVWIDDSVTPNCLMLWDCNANGGAGAYVTFTQEGAGSGGASVVSVSAPLPTDQLAYTGESWSSFGNYQQADLIYTVPAGVGFISVPSVINPDTNSQRFLAVSQGDTITIRVRAEQDNTPNYDAAGVVFVNGVAVASATPVPDTGINVGLAVQDNGSDPSLYLPFTTINGVADFVSSNLLITNLPDNAGALNGSVAPGTRTYSADVLLYAAT